MTITVSLQREIASGVVYVYKWSFSYFFTLHQKCSSMSRDLMPSYTWFFKGCCFQLGCTPCSWGIGRPVRCCEGCIKQYASPLYWGGKSRTLASLELCIRCISLFRIRQAPQRWFLYRNFLRIFLTIALLFNLTRWSSHGCSMNWQPCVHWKKLLTS